MPFLASSKPLNKWHGDLIHLLTRCRHYAGPILILLNLHDCLLPSLVLYLHLSLDLACSGPCVSSWLSSNDLLMKPSWYFSSFFSWLLSHGILMTNPLGPSPPGPSSFLLSPPLCSYFAWGPMTGMRSPAQFSSAQITGWSALYQPITGDGKQPLQVIEIGDALSIRTMQTSRLQPDLWAIICKWQSASEYTVYKTIPQQSRLLASHML